MAEEQKQQDTAEDEALKVLSVVDAIDAIVENVIEKTPDIADRGPPVAIAVLALWPDKFEHWLAGPAGEPGVYLQMLGNAGVDAARQMQVPVGGEEPSKLIVPSSAILVPH